jgi:rhamnosyltransferase
MTGVASSKVIDAVVVTFNPDLEGYIEGLMAIAPQVRNVIVVDNASANAQQIEAATLRTGHATMIRRARNDGIAVALNAGIATAIRDGASHLVLLDQDSVPSLDMVDILANASDDSVGIAAPAMIDRNLGAAQKRLVGTTDENFAITSGSLVSGEAWEAVGGYDEAMFIDYCDFDFCLRLRLMGFRVIRAHQALLTHEIGAARRRGGVVAYNYSPFRLQHMARDMMYYARKHKGEPAALRVWHRGPALTFLAIARKVAVVLFVEQNRIPTAFALIRGLLAGMRMPLPPPTCNPAGK